MFQNVAKLSPLQSGVQMHNLPSIYDPKKNQHWINIEHGHRKNAKRLSKCYGFCFQYIRINWYKYKKKSACHSHFILLLLDCPFSPFNDIHEIFS